MQINTFSLDKFMVYISATQKYTNICSIRVHQHTKNINDACTYLSSTAFYAQGFDVEA